MKSLNCSQGFEANLRNMKTTILLFAVFFGYIIPTYSQLNRHRKTDTTSEQFQTRKNYDFLNYKVDKFSDYEFDKFNDFLSNRERDIFNMSPARPAPSSSQGKYIQRSNMPCFHPKSGDKMPCSEPMDTFHMRVFKPTDTIWGILW
jgi:hypothetical protein